MLGGLEQALLAVLLIVLMVGMGATLTLSSFRDVARSPRGVIIGLLSQFGWMPLIAFSLASALELSPALAVGLLIVGCTPGGTTSNLFTYYSRANVALSISMTVVSTMVAVVLMPLLVGAYSAGFEGVDFEVPLGKIATTLALVLVPVVIGMAIRARSESAAKRAEKLGAVSGIIVLLVLIVSSLVRNRALFSEIPFAGYVGAFLLGLVGLVLGYAAATIARLPVPDRRAVALETGIQNSPLAFAVVLATLPADVQEQAIRLPMLYALFVLITASVASVIFASRGTGAAASEAAEV